MSISRPGLVIFDCDGVLVDSERISVEVLLGVVVAGGARINEEAAYRHFLGRSMASVVETLRSDFNFIVTDAQLGSIRTSLAERFRCELKPISGVADVLARLDLPRCVASSGLPERIRLSLGVTGLLELFEPHIYSASMVENGKPAPDLFLYAARQMGVRPGACVVVEDSPAGITAARRAGMRVFAFAGGSHMSSAALRQAIAHAEPDCVFQDMQELPQLLKVAAGSGAAAAWTR